MESDNDNRRDASAPLDRRWAMRRGVELEADLTDSTGRAFAARITDISEEGCTIRMLAPVEPDRDRLHEIKITGLEPLGAYVVWSGDGKAGLVFSTPLHSLTVRSLVTKSLYARLSRRMASTPQRDDAISTLPPFPFED